jgi:hypothetical protein
MSMIVRGSRMSIIARSVTPLLTSTQIVSLFLLARFHINSIYLTAVLQNVHDIHSIITSDYADMDAVDREECNTTTEDMADFIHSIID